MTITPRRARDDARTTDDTPQSPWAPQFRLVLLGMLTLISAGAFEGMAVVTVMPVVVEALGGIELYAMAFAAPMAGGVLGMVVSGVVTDRRGPAAPTTGGALLFGAGLVIAGLAQSMLTVAVGRLVQGVGTGLFIVALYVVVARVFPARLQPRVFAAFSAAWVVPAIVGPALGGVVATTVGWRWVFLGVPVLCVPAVLALRPALRGVVAVEPTESGQDAVAGGRARATRGLMAAGIAVSAGALALHAGGQRLEDGFALVPALVVAVGLVLLILAAPRLFPHGTWRAARGLPSVVLLRGFVAAAFFGAEAYVSLLLQRERGMHPSTAGVALTLGALTWSLGSWVRGRQPEGRDRALLAVGSSMVATGVVVAALTVVPAVPVAVAALGWSLGGFGMGLCYPTLSLLTLRLSAPAEQGRNTSALQVNESMSIAVVLALLGPLFVALRTVGPVPAYLAVFAIATASGLAALAVSGRVLPADQRVTG